MSACILKDMSLILDLLENLLNRPEALQHLLRDHEILGLSVLLFVARHPVKLLDGLQAAEDLHAIVPASLVLLEERVRLEEDLLQLGTVGEPHHLGPVVDLVVGNVEHLQVGERLDAQKLVEQVVRDPQLRRGAVASVTSRSLD